MVGNIDLSHLKEDVEKVIQSTLEGFYGGNWLVLLGQISQDD